MIKKLRVTVDGKSYDVTVELADEPAAPAPAASGPAPLPTITPAAVSPVSAPKALAAVAKPAARAGANDIPSPLSGRVTAVNAQAGQAVKEGDHLLTLEAMKMNTFITAPRDGTVKDVKVAVGDVVDEGQALVTLD
jgi:glutaconyl-CoA/methylmalonyl-CoA decarboxylase subunit gamma